MPAGGAWEDDDCPVRSRQRAPQASRSVTAVGSSVPGAHRPAPTRAMRVGADRLGMPPLGTMVHITLAAVGQHARHMGWYGA